MNIRPSFVTFFACLLSAAVSTSGQPSTGIDIESRRELFVNDFLIDRMDGTELRLHRPVPREIAIIHDQPWEGNVCYYHTVFRDGDIFRMFYRGAHAGSRKSYPKAEGHQVVCYAESQDGIHWTKPNLGLYEFDGSKENNIIWNGIGSHNFAPFKDANPECTTTARYKAIGSGKGGLYAFQSSDAIHWSLMHEKPIITKGAFDSQNLAFYDTARGRYVDFHRGFNEGVRAIMTCTSDDFLTWTDPDWVRYNDDFNPHLYTNQTTAYHRAPHILMSFPKRFVPSRNPTIHRHSGVSDIIFMTSRDGLTFNRWSEAFLRPGLQKERWVNRNNFVAWGIIETANQRVGIPDEMSFYSMEGYYSGDDCRMRRYTMRPDGFVSVNASLEGGELITKPLTFALPTDETARTVEDDAPQPSRVDSDHPIRGKGSLAFDSATILTLGGTKELGKHATLAVTVRDVPAGHRRLFSTYNGGSTEPHELYFDVDSRRAISHKDGYSIRFNYNGILVGASFTEVGDWSHATNPDLPHHIAATWNDGLIKIYFDGRLVGSGGKPGSGELRFKQGDLRFGEDYPPTPMTNEPFLGLADDIMVVRRTLSEDEIVQLASPGTGIESLASDDQGILLTMDDLSAPLEDGLQHGGRDQVRGPVTNEPGDVELRINFASSAAGSIRCELLDVAGDPIAGFTAKDSDELYGDSLDRAMSWNGSRELKSLAGKPIRLRFLMKDADMYSLRFGR